MVREPGGTQYALTVPMENSDEAGIENTPGSYSPKDPVSVDMSGAVKMWASQVPVVPAGAERTIFFLMNWTTEGPE